jgi:hypothetical protein
MKGRYCDEDRLLLRRQRKKEWELKRHATHMQPGCDGPAMGLVIRKQSESCSCESPLVRVASNPVTLPGF